MKNPNFSEEEKSENPYLSDVHWYLNENNQIVLKFKALKKAKIYIEGVANARPTTTWMRVEGGCSWLHLDPDSFDKSKRTFGLYFPNLSSVIATEIGKEYEITSSSGCQIKEASPTLLEGSDFQAKKNSFGLNDYLSLYLEEVKGDRPGNPQNPSYLDSYHYLFGLPKIEITSPVNYSNSSNSKVALKIAYQNPRAAPKKKIYLTLFEKGIGGNKPGEIDFSKVLASSSIDIQPALEGSSTFDLNLPASSAYRAYLSFEEPILSAPPETLKKGFDYQSIDLNYTESGGNNYIGDIRWGYATSTQNGTSTRILTFSFKAKAKTNILIRTSLNETFERDEEGNLGIRQYGNYYASSSSPTSSAEYFYQAGKISQTSRKYLGSASGNLLYPVKGSGQDWLPSKKLVQTRPSIFPISSETSSLPLNSISWFKNNNIYTLTTNPPNHLSQRDVQAFFRAGNFGKMELTNSDKLFLYIEEFKISGQQASKVNQVIDNISYPFEEK